MIGMPHLNVKPYGDKIDKDKFKHLIGELDVDVNVFLFFLETKNTPNSKLEKFFLIVRLAMRKNSNNFAFCFQIHLKNRN
jgi:hypothetical protein